MQEKKTQKRDSSDRGKLPKAQAACEEMETFLGMTRDTNDAIGCLMYTIESIWDHLDEQVADDLAEAETRRTCALLTLLAEKADKLKNHAICSNRNLAAFARD